MRGIQHRVRNAWLDFVAIDALRLHGTATVVRSSAEDGRDGAFLEHGISWGHLPNRGRLRTRLGRDLRRGWHDRTVQPAAFNWDFESGLAKAARRLFEISIRNENRTTTRRAQRKNRPRLPKNKRSGRSRKNGERRCARAQSTTENTTTQPWRKLREMGVNLVPVEMPNFPYDAMRTMLTAESAAAFDDLTRSGKDKL